MASFSCRALHRRTRLESEGICSAFYATDKALIHAAGLCYGVHAQPQSLSPLPQSVGDGLLQAAWFVMGHGQRIGLTKSVAFGLLVRTLRSPLAGSGGWNKYDPNSLANPYGAGSPYKADGLMNPYSQYGSQYSNKSWTNPNATDAPKIYGQDGTYHGRLSTNKYDADSTSNPYGRYGSKYSPDSLNNPYGAGNPYSGTQYYVAPQ